MNNASIGGVFTRSTPRSRTRSRSRSNTGVTIRLYIQQVAATRRENNEIKFRSKKYSTDYFTKKSFAVNNSNALCKNSKNLFTEYCDLVQLYLTNPSGSFINYIKHSALTSATADIVGTIGTKPPIGG